MPTLATFNVNNFFLRYQFAKTYPGDQSGKSAVLAATVSQGYIPEKKFGKYLSKDFVIWDPVRRELAAQALSEPDGKLPDILCLQEVENMDALRKFNQDHLGSYYRYHLLIDGRDPRNIDVAVLSRFPIARVRSHLDDIVEKTRPTHDRWTYYWRAKGRVQQIDHVLASKALAARVTQTHIARAGLSYRALNGAGEALPKEVTVTHFDNDGVTPKPKAVTPNERVAFGFERYEPIFENLGNNISDHCPVKVWF